MSCPDSNEPVSRVGARSLRLVNLFGPMIPDAQASMYYHFAILLLFRPLIKLRIIGSSISPRDVCSQAADAISGLLRSYAQLYTLRRTPSFVPYFVLTSSIMHLAIAATGRGAARSIGAGSDAGPSTHHSPRMMPKVSPHVAEALSRGIADLTEMAPCHNFAEQALNILRYLAKKWNIDVEIKTASGEVMPQTELVDVTHRSTRPVTSSLNFFAPNFVESDFNCVWGSGGTVADAAKLAGAPPPMGAARVAHALENPLFWPFPMQGRPMLPTGDELKEAEFELI